MKNIFWVVAALLTGTLPTVRAQPPDEFAMPQTARLFLNGAQTRGARMAAWSPDGKFILALYDSPRRQATNYLMPPQAVLWDAKSGALIGALPYQGDGVFNARFSADGKGIFGSVAYRSDEAGEGDNLYGSATTPDGKVLSSFYYRRELRLWDTENILRPDESLPILMPFAIPKTFFPLPAPDGKQLLLSNSAQLDLYNLESGKTTALEADEEFSSPKRRFSEAAFSPDATRLAVAFSFLQENGETARKVGEVLIWNLQSRKIERKISFDDAAHQIRFLADGKTIAISSQKAEYRVQKQSGGKFYLPNRLPFPAAPKPDEWRVTLFNIDSGATLLSWPCASHAPIRLAISPDGNLIATSETIERREEVGENSYTSYSTTTIRFHDSRNGTELHSLNAGSPVNDLQFSINGRKLLTAQEEGIKIRDIQIDAKQFGKKTVNTNEVTLALVYQSHAPGKPEPSTPGWLAYTAQGFYESSWEVENHINWAIDNQQVDTTTHRQILHRPLKIQLALQDK